MPVCNPQTASRSWNNTATAAELEPTLPAAVLSDFPALLAFLLDPGLGPGLSRGLSTRRDPGLGPGFFRGLSTLLEPGLGPGFFRTFTGATSPAPGGEGPPDI